MTSQYSGGDSICHTMQQFTGFLDIHDIHFCGHVNNRSFLIIVIVEWEHLD